MQKLILNRAYLRHNLYNMLILLDWLWVDALTIYPFMFMRRDKYNIYMLNHEYIHTRQQLECGVVGLVFGLILSLIMRGHFWLPLIFAFSAYYIYWIEFIVKYFYYGRDKVKAYAFISFERESFAHQHIIGYAKNRPLFAWFKFIYISDKKIQDAGRQNNSNNKTSKTKKNRR